MAVKLDAAAVYANPPVRRSNVRTFVGGANDERHPSYH